ncbi:HNH endonuclease [Priestia sp. P5]|uniref:HNH endonuclease n=1 Tax=Priestia sp. P5 TaxID=2917806 RepID=UPI00064B7845|nr:HNH endonuclease [Priestia sp. P5]MDG0059013.1 EVE domain-containing protein [Priestia sp. P5]
MNTWIFQGNPRFFDVDTYIKNHKYIWWSLRQEHFLDKIELDDEVFLWRSDGNNRGTGGILAKAKVISLPVERTNDETAQNYWYTDEWKNPYLAVELEVLQVKWEGGFINRLSLLEHPVLKDLLILRQRTQTNYLLSQRHAITLQKLWNNSHDIIKSKVSVESDMKNLISDDITETEREQVIKSRIGQSAFKKGLLAIENKCRLCGVTNEQFLVASHIKPWNEANHQERLDIDNGLLLCPNHDALFDKGYISFDTDGKIIISDYLDEGTRIFLNINENMNIEMNEGQQEYMKWHKEYLLIN